MVQEVVKKIAEKILFSAFPEHSCLVGLTEIAACIILLMSLCASWSPKA